MSVVKLDKMTFARLIAHCVSNGMSAGEYEVNTLDDIVQIEIPEEPSSKFSVHSLAAMLEAMKNERKIEAIKEHRQMTGYGLKESKDFIEKYMVTDHKPETLKKMLRTIDAQIRGEEDAPIAPILKGFTTEQLLMVRNFIESYE